MLDKKSITSAGEPGQEAWAGAALDKNEVGVVCLKLALTIPQGSKAAAKKLNQMFPSENTAELSGPECRRMSSGKCNVHRGMGAVFTGTYESDGVRKKARMAAQVV